MVKWRRRVSDSTVALVEDLRAFLWLLSEYQAEASVWPVERQEKLEPNWYLEEAKRYP